jgi:hypothetical protein
MSLYPEFFSCATVGAFTIWRRQRREAAAGAVSTYRAPRRFDGGDPSLVVPPAGALPAASLMPGYRWQRSSRHTDDPDVDGLYRRLCETGYAAPPRLRVRGDDRELHAVYALATALIRRAAEDGYHLRRWAFGGVFIDRPLTADDADPYPRLHREAAAWYEDLLQAGCITWESPRVRPLEWLPLQELWDRDVIVAEVARLADTDGYRITDTLRDDLEYCRTEGGVTLHRD